MSEHAIASHFEYLCAVAGSQRPAYVPVVASGLAEIQAFRSAR
jgi:intermediate cleaving peptidase 55